MTHRKKLIEVALPLEAINAASAREKSIRHGHPSTLHLWWARRPLAAARAVIFAQMVDDPSSCPEEFPTEEAQTRERQRLHDLIGHLVPEVNAKTGKTELRTEGLVAWENTTNQRLFERAHREIRRSWARECIGRAMAELTDEQIADRMRTGEIPPLPGFHDPFAGGGTLPLEAQRLGIEAYASDLNPVAVLINKAIIEIPPRFAGKTPINPEARAEKTLLAKEWNGAMGLAEDVRYYGQWMRDEADKRIGHLYPKVEVTAEMAKDRPDLKPYVGKELTVIAWIWARTVKSPNPAFVQVDVPLASTFMLSTKPGKEAYAEPIIEGSSYSFAVKVGKPTDTNGAKSGTKMARGANFRCVMSGAPISPDYIRSEAQANRMGARMMAIVAEGERGRVYLSPTPHHESLLNKIDVGWAPATALPVTSRYMTPTLYGMTNWRDLFTSRQLSALTTFSELVIAAGDCVRRDASDAGLGDVESREYANAIAVYLSVFLSRLIDLNNALCQWRNDPAKQHVGHLFSRQAIPMVWDFAEANPVGKSAGGFDKTFVFIPKIFDFLASNCKAEATQADAQSQLISAGKVVSTDPPYYDNVPYADLSDFFYVWLRRSLQPIYPDLFSTLAVPKLEELVATPERHGGKTEAESFFLDGMTSAMRQLAKLSHSGFPVTIYYAFKQSESEGEAGTASTGWETFLDAVIRAGFGISGTWPMRTELGNRMRGVASNALASSIVLVCRKRAEDAPTATRREFVGALRRELPEALRNLQRGNIAPVDLAQAAIGPGMAIYTRYSQVLEQDGSPLTVRTALGLINQVLDELLAEQEGEFDPDTRCAVAWYEQFGLEEGPFGEADVLARAKNTSVAGLESAGVLRARAGKVRLLRRDELPADWDPTSDSRTCVWEVMQHLLRALLVDGSEEKAAKLLQAVGSRGEAARDLAYRLYGICERKKRAEEALAYNTLVVAWPVLQGLAQSQVTDAATANAAGPQTAFEYE